MNDKQKPSRALVIAASFFALFGVWEISFAFESNGWVGVVHRGGLGAAFLATAALLYRGVRWSRYLCYVWAAVVVVFDWAYRIVYYYLTTPAATHEPLTTQLIGLLISLVPVAGFVGAAFVAHRTLGPKGT